MSGPRRPTVGLLWRHPAHLIAFGAGSGLSPWAPGTVGTLWAWASFLPLQLAIGSGPHADAIWALLLVAGWFIGCWACTRTARTLGVADPGSIVWDEIWAFWLMLWVIGPADGWGHLAAFVCFRFFDAVKPGPVAWADGLFKLRPGEAIGWRQGLGIMFDDLVAALCALLTLAVALMLKQIGTDAGILP